MLEPTITCVLDAIATRTSIDIEHVRELVEAHRALFLVGELDQYLVEGFEPPGR